jgi:hypothetical protein
MPAKNRISEINVEETSLTIRRIADLFLNPDLDIFKKENIHRLHYFSVIAEIVIHLRDLAAKLSIIGETFHIDVNGSSHHDITSLLKFYRDAICHNESPNRRNKNGFIFSHNVYAAYDFPDEITILTGDSKLFLRRHLFLGYITALQKFEVYSEFQSNSDFRTILETFQYYNAFQKPLEYRSSRQ